MERGGVNAAPGNRGSLAAPLKKAFSPLKKVFSCAASSTRGCQEMHEFVGLTKDRAHAESEGKHPSERAKKANKNEGWGTPLRYLVKGGGLRYVIW